MNFSRVFDIHTLITEFYLVTHLNSILRRQRSDYKNSLVKDAESRYSSMENFKENVASC